jgi:hypothetical protein
MLKNKRLYNIRWERTEFKENKKKKINQKKITFIVKNMFV